MDKKLYPRIGEEVIWETLDNGLPVCIVPKQGFSRKYALFATRYGGMDMRFELNGQWLDTPAGIAHYLEHKMFDTKDGNALQVRCPCTPHCRRECGSLHRFRPGGRDRTPSPCRRRNGCPVLPRPPPPDAAARGSRPRRRRHRAAARGRTSAPLGRDPAARAAYRGCCCPDAGTGPSGPRRRSRAQRRHRKRCRS